MRGDPPLGLDPVIDDAELEACLLYAGALKPSFQASTGRQLRCGLRRDDGS
jgi:hypothetical protein